MIFQRSGYEAVGGKEQGHAVVPGRTNTEISLRDAGLYGGVPRYDTKNSSSSRPTASGEQQDFQKILRRVVIAAFFFQVSGQELERMCDLKAYIRKNGKEELVLESVNQVSAEKGQVVFRNLFGEEKKVQGEVREVSLVKNRIVVEPV